MDGSYQNWTLFNAPCDLEGEPLWDSEDKIIWVPVEEFESGEQVQE